MARVRPLVLSTGLWFVGSCVLAVSAAAQGRIVEWGLVYANAFATGGPTSVVQTTDLRTLEVEVVLRGHVGDGWRLEYPVGAVLNARLANTALGPAAIFPVWPRGEWRVPSAAGRRTAQGIGLRPFGIRLVGGPSFLELQTDAAVGGLLFDIPAPASNTSRFNFTAELGFGARVAVPGGHFNVGYRLHHLSNGGRGEVNPAVDSNMFYVGVSLR